jgi:endonuclease YncB( thermonuclease family)
MSWRRRHGAAAAAALLLLLVAAAGAPSDYQAAGVTRHADGDTFYLKKDGECTSCVFLSVFRSQQRDSDY